MQRIRWYGPTLVLLITVLLVLVAGPGVVRNLVHVQRDAKIGLVREQLRSNPSLAALSEEFSRVAEAVGPSVVQVEVFAKPDEGFLSSQQERLREWLERNAPGIPLPFGEDDSRGPDGGGDGEDFDEYNLPQQSGNGSGWVYDRQGHIITNHHVIRRAEKIQIRFFDGSVKEAEVVASDPKTDVAVLKVDGGSLHPAAIAEQTVRQGEIVFAFGSPFRFQNSMSQGIVSAVNRSDVGILQRQGGYENFIQTDAAINPGNSGGPLTNIRGEVVGMNTAIATRGGRGLAPWAATFSGLGFAIPAQTVVDVADALISEGKVRRGFLGIDMGSEDLSPELARTFGFEGEGVLVLNALPGYPAAEAGLQRGDIITRVNDTKIESNTQLRNLISSFPPGKTIEIEVFREGEYKTFSVTLAELPDRVARRGSGELTPPDAPEQAVLKKLGFEQVETATESLMAEAGLEFTPGVLVGEVRPGSAAAEQGLRRGSLITHVQGVAVANVDEFVAELKKRDLTQGVRVSVQEGEIMRFALLKLPKD